MSSNRGSVKGFKSAEIVQSKAFEDSKFRIGISKLNDGVFKLVTTNAPVDGGNKAPILSFYGSMETVVRMANHLKEGKTYNYAYTHRYG